MTFAWTFGLSASQLLTVEQRPQDSALIRLFVPSTRLLTAKLFAKSIHEREDAYPVAQNYADLLVRGVWLFLTWQEWFADAVGLKSVSDSVRPLMAGAFSRALQALSSAGRSNRPNMRSTDSSGPSPNQV